MSRKHKKKQMEERLAEDQLFQEIYGLEMELPEILAGKLQLVSCLAFQEERQVYLAEDKDGRRYILKRAEGSQKQFLRKEADSLKHFHYSFMPEFISWTEAADSGWLQREYISGDTLWELVERDGPFEPEEAGALMCRLCEMTGQLHAADPPVIHRDLKPQNFILTVEENLFLIDFGTVREYDEDADYDTVFVGTRQTAAPEQYGYRQTDCRTDIYALGVIYLYLLTGSMDLQESRYWELVPRDCRAVIEKCTMFSPGDRYQNCRDLKKAILAAEPDLSDPQRKAGLPGLWRRRKTELPDSQRRRKTELPDSRMRRKAELLDSRMRRETDSVDSQSRGKVRKLHWKPAAIGVICLAALICGGRYLAETCSPYQFSSELIGQAVRARLGKEENEPVLKFELAKIETLRICGSCILEDSDNHWQNCGHHNINGGDDNETQGTVADLSDCARMKNLRTLVLDKQQITDLTPLQGLPLETVSLCDNPITDLSPLSSLETLKELSVEETKIRDLTPLSGLDTLLWLDIGNTDVTDLTPLENMGIETLKMVAVFPENSDALLTLPLRKLLLNSASAEQEDKISRITTLKELTIYNYRRESLEPLLNLKGLVLLDLYGGNLSSLEGIAQFAELQSLIIGKTRVSDLSPIKDLTGLIYMGLENSLVTDFSVLKEMQWFRWLGCSKSQKAALDQEIPEPEFAVEVYEDDPLMQ